MSYFTFAYTLTYTFVYMILQQIYSGNYVPIKFHQNRPSIIRDITKSRLVSYFPDAVYILPAHITLFAYSCWLLYNDNNKSNLRRKHWRVRPPSYPSDVYLKLLMTCPSFCKPSYTDICTARPVLFDYCNATQRHSTACFRTSRCSCLLVVMATVTHARTGEETGPRGRDKGDIDWCQQY